jgi:hypothetical protein
MKRCRYCEKTFPLSEFAVKSPRCRGCQRIYSRQHYQLNKRRYLDRNKRTKDEKYDLVRAAKSKPCMDCGKSYPYYVMEFDHVTAGTKSFTIGTDARSHTIEKILKELDKCEVVCSNCHRIRTFNRSHRLR